MFIFLRFKVGHFLISPEIPNGKEDAKMSSLIGVIGNIGSDLILEIIQRTLFSPHLGFRGHIHSISCSLSFLTKRENY